jgi:hypothetical protein
MNILRLLVLCCLFVISAQAANSCVTVAVDVDVNEGQSGYVITYKAVVNDGPNFVGKFISSFNVPFGTSAATALSAWKTAVVQAAAGKGITLLTSQITVYGASIN